MLQKCAGGGASKTQIVQKSCLNFRIVVPYLDLLTNRGLVVRAEGQIPVCTGLPPKGEKALGHPREAQKLHKRRRMGWQRETMSCERL
ncbi:winged helix-turn-helix domain-containing protein [Methanothrix soehngenii]|uniref:winged helix-turn-helix domain-containing protein n=1 Tax=Methanothrix soehngenii TaxID=2223 RepID=UPI00373AE6C9